MLTVIKKAPVLLLLGIILALGGCVDTLEEEPEEAIQQVETEEEVQETDVSTEKDEAETEKAVDEEKETVKSKPAVVTPPAEKKPASATKPTPAKKTETSGTTAQVPVTLVKTIDGDTIKVLYNGKEMNVRYLLIDTPETNHPRLGKQPFGEEAKERNRQLVNSGALTLEFDIGERVDKYDRLLAYVYVDGKSVQKTLLAEGLARVAYVYPPNTRHLTPFEEAQAAAKKKGLGIWSVENYATDSGFNSEATAKPATTHKSPVATSKPATKPSTSASGEKEWFQNCTELKKKYPSGVPEGHAAYQPKMDRDKDGYACE